MAATVPDIMGLLLWRGLPAEIAMQVVTHVQLAAPSPQPVQDISMSAPYWSLCANGACPLLQNTPFEIRRKIYDMLLPNCDAIVPGQQNRFRVGEPCHATIPLLLTSRQISIEVFSVLYGERMFDIHLTDEGIRYLNRPPLQTLEELGFKVRVPAGNAKFQRENEEGTFGFSRVRNVHIKIFGSKDAGYMFTRSIHYRHMMKSLVDLMRTNPSNIVEIVIEFLADPDIWRRRGNIHIPQPSRLHPLSLIEYICHPLGYLRDVNKVNIILPDSLVTNAGLQRWVRETQKTMQSPGPYVSSASDQLSEQHFERIEQESVDQQMRRKWGFGFYKNDDEKRGEARAINYVAEEPEVPGGQEGGITRRFTHSMCQARAGMSSEPKSTNTSHCMPSTTRKRTRPPPEPRAQDELQPAMTLPFRPSHPIGIWSNPESTTTSAHMPSTTRKRTRPPPEPRAQDEQDLATTLALEQGPRRKKRSLDDGNKADGNGSGARKIVLPIRPLRKQSRGF